MSNRLFDLDLTGLSVDHVKERRGHSSSAHTPVMAPALYRWRRHQSSRSAVSGSRSSRYYHQRHWRPRGPHQQCFLGPKPKPKPNLGPPPHRRPRRPRGPRFGPPRARTTWASLYSRTFVCDCICDSDCPIGCASLWDVGSAIAKLRATAKHGVRIS